MISGTLNIYFAIAEESSPIYTAANWSITYGGINDDDLIENIAIDPRDGSIYLVGSTNKSGIDYDYLLIKFNSAGTKLWEKTYDSGNNDYGKDVAVDPTTGDVYIIGTSAGATEDIIVVKYNSAGTYQWYIIRDSGGTDYGNAIAVDSSGNITFTGRYDHDLYIGKIDSNKIGVWADTWGDGGGQVEWGNDIIIDSNDNIYITGADSYIAPGRAFLLKYNSSGSFKWEIGISDISDTRTGNAIAMDSQGYIYIAGEVNTNPFSVIVGKYKDNGVSASEEWYKEFSNPAGDHKGVDIYLDKSDTLHVALELESPNSSFILMNLTNTGTSIANSSFEYGDDKFIRVAHMDASGNIYIAGIVATGPSNEYDILLIKIEAPSTPDVPPPDEFPLLLVVIIIGAAVGVGGIGIYVYLNKKKEG